MVVAVVAGLLAGGLAAAVVVVSPPAAAQSMPGAGERGDVVSTAVLAPEHWIPGAAEAIGITYLSTRSGGTIALTSGALFVPPGPPPPGGWPIVAWAHGTTGLGDDCAPTVLGRTPRDLQYLAAWLGAGYAIAATDYVGLGTPGVHPYLDGRTAARNVVDMVRAARTARATDGDLSDRWVVVGQSQGGHAALFTATMAADDAPELDFRGAVATGPANHVSGQAALFAHPGLPLPDLFGTGVFLAYMLAGLRVARPDFPVDSYLTSTGRAMIDDAEVLCYSDMVERSLEAPIGSWLRKPIDAPLRAALDAVSRVPDHGYDCPFYIAQGGLDLVVTPVNTLLLVLELVVKLQPMTFAVYPLSDHGGTMAASLPDTRPWVAHRFAAGPCP